MCCRLTDFLTARLNDRQQAGLLRQLRHADALIDFCSNDYLGFARSPSLKAAIDQATATWSGPVGATGSRLLAGHTHLADTLESNLAQFYQTEAALGFNSGYDANLGLLACLPQRGDTLITDALVHASMIDGARLSYATRYQFRHNDLSDLEVKLIQTRATHGGQVFVAVESVYSMDGDMAPLVSIADLCDRYGAFLLVDEAHATGLYGPTGEGLVVTLGLQRRVLARVHTFGKALGVHGAAVVGSVALRHYLINFARPFIYSTALPPQSLLAIQTAHQQLAALPQARQQLHEQVAYYRQHALAKLPHVNGLSSQSPIQGVLVPGNENARRVASLVQQAGFDVRAILSPTVPVGQERLRICLHCFNTNDQIDRLLHALAVAL